MNAHSIPCFQRESEATSLRESAQSRDIIFAKNKQFAGCEAKFDIAVRKPAPRRFPSVYKLLDACNHQSFVRIRASGIRDATGRGVRFAGVGHIIAGARSSKCEHRQSPSLRGLDEGATQLFERSG